MFPITRTRIRISTHLLDRSVGSRRVLEELRRLRQFRVQGFGSTGPLSDLCDVP